MTGSQLLKEAVNGSGQSLRSVAGRIGVSHGYLHDLMHGRRETPSIRLAGIIENELGIPVSAWATNTPARKASTVNNG